MLTALDLMGLAGISVVLALQDRDPAADSFYMTMIVVGLGTWLLVAQVRSLSTILESSRNYPLYAPTFAVLIVWLMRYLTDDYLSWAGAAAFAAGWTGWMAVWRLVRHYYLPPIRILTIGSADILSELDGVSRISVMVANRPPDRFEGFDVVALDPAANHPDEWLKWLLHADMAGIKLLAAPLIIETLTKQLPLDALSGEWARYLVGARSPYGEWKRLVDISVTLLLTPLWLPLLGVVLLAVYLDDGGPVIFRQERMGRYRRPFKMAKVRSMRQGADSVGPAFAGADDPRITRVGRVIRRYRLDELPQFWNVLMGDMSIIGPRPEQVPFSKEFENRFPLYSLRYNLRPGITGWAQVKQGYAADADENYGKLRHDLYYVRHVSPSLDGQIVLRTLAVLFSGFGAR